MLSQILSESLIMVSRDKILSQTSQTKLNKKKHDRVIMEVKRKLQRIADFIEKNRENLEAIKRALEVTGAKSNDLKKLAKSLLEVNDIENQMYELHQLKSHILERLDENSKMVKKIIRTIDKYFEELRSLRDESLKVADRIAKKIPPVSITEKNKKVNYIIDKLLNKTFKESEKALKAFGYKKFPRIKKSIYKASGIPTSKSRDEIAGIRFARFIELSNLPSRLSNKPIKRMYLVLYTDIYGNKEPAGKSSSDFYVALVDKVIDPLLIKKAYKVSSIMDANIAISNLFFENNIEIIPGLEPPEKWRERKKRLAKKGVLRVIGVNPHIKVKVQNKKFLVKIPFSELSEETVNYIKENQEEIEKSTNAEFILADRVLVDVFLDVAKILGVHGSKRGRKKDSEKLSKGDKKLIDKKLKYTFRVEDDNLIMIFATMPLPVRKETYQVFEKSPEYIKRTILRGE